MRRAPARDGWVIGGLSLLCYVLLGRFAFHGQDVYQLLWGSYTGQLHQHLYCLFYLPLLDASRALFEPLGASPYRAGLMVSATGMAFGVFCAHLASRILGVDRSTAAMATVLVAACPPVVYFATVTEVHGTGFMFCGMAWVAIAWWSVGLATGGAWRRAIVVGFMLVLAWLAHPTAGMLGSVMLPLAMLVRGDRIEWRWIVRDGGIALLLLSAGMLFLPDLLRELGGQTDTAFQVDFAQKRWLINATLQRVPVILWRDWLLPLAPISIALLVLVGRRASRFAASTAAMAFLPFIFVHWFLCYDIEKEHGVYAIAVVYAGAVVAARFVRSRGWRGVMLCCAVAASAWLYSGIHEDQLCVDTRIAVDRAVGDDSTMWLAGNEWDAQAILTRSRPVLAVALPELMIAHPTGEDLLPRLDTFISQQIAKGGRVVVTSNAFDLLHDFAGQHMGARRLMGWLRERRGDELAREGEVVCWAVRGQP